MRAGAMARAAQATVALAIGVLFSSEAVGSEPATAAPAPLPPVLQRGLPGPGHQVLNALEGTFRVEMQVYLGTGTPDRPLVSTGLRCRRHWVADGRFLHDVTTGDFAGRPYFRQGLLGYSNVDQRYEWVTVDSANANMMIYQGQPGSGPLQPIVVAGRFTDQGWLGEPAAGREIRMRTVITVESRERHTFELYFTPPGGTERLVDRKIYTRVPP